MSHPHAQVNPEMLRWARGRMGMDIHNAAVAAGVKPEQLERWEAGDGLPTFRQAQNVAQALHAPFGFFFLQQAPAEEPLLPDLRTVGGRTVESPSVDLLETIKQALQRQAWYLEYQQEQGGAAHGASGGLGGRCPGYRGRFGLGPRGSGDPGARTRVPGPKFPSGSPTS